MTIVSVIMPARNAASTIKESIHSVLGTEGVGELIVVDDQSRDKTAQIVQAIIDPRIRLLTGLGRGISAALNLGFAAARGDFISRCDADDLYPADRFAWQIPLLQDDPNIAAVSGGFRTITSRGRPIADLACVDGPQDVTSALLGGAPNSTFCAWLTRKSAIIASGGAREWFTTAEDLDLMFRIAEQGRVWHHPKVAYLYRLHENSIVHTQSNHLRQFFEETARNFASDRLRTGDDDLGRGCPPPLPMGNSSRMSAREQTLGLLIGKAWTAHALGQRKVAILTAFRALTMAPLSMHCMKQVILLLLKSIRKLP